MKQSCVKCHNGDTESRNETGTRATWPACWPSPGRSNATSPARAPAFAGRFLLTGLIAVLPVGLAGPLVSIADEEHEEGIRQCAMGTSRDERRIDFDIAKSAAASCAAKIPAPGTG